MSFAKYFEDNMEIIEERLRSASRRTNTHLFTESHRK